MNNQIIKDLVASDDIKVISFDIFDTLLLRPCLFPHNLFRIVGRRCGFQGNFEELRREAERIARQKRPEDEDDITLDDIYRELTTFIGADMAEQLKQTELQVEMQYLYPRKAIQDIFHYALSEGKKVIIVSDMYLSASFLAEVLEKNGFAGYEKLYVSSEYKLSKGSKRLFEKVIEDLSEDGILPEEILHIGDNANADVRNSEACGMKAFHVESGVNAMKKSRRFSSLTRTHTLVDNVFIIGLIANTYFDSFLDDIWNDSYFDGKLEHMMSMMMSPLLFSFVKWMLDDCRAANIDTLALIYRDGYIPEKIINLLKPCYKNDIPNLVRIDLSRRALACFALNNKNGLTDALLDRRENAQMSVGDFLELIALIPPEEHQEVFSVLQPLGYTSLEDPVGTTAQQLQIADLIKPWFEKHAAQSLQVTSEYIRTKLQDCGNLAVFDIGYSGRISRILTEQLNIPNRGYHMFHYSYRKKASYIASAITLTKENTSNHNALLEDLISIQTSSAQKIVKNPETGAFTVVRAKTIHFAQNIDNMQNCLLKDVEQYVSVYGTDLAAMNFDIMEFYTSFRNFLNGPTRKDLMMLKKMSFEDDNNVPNSMYESWYAQHYERIIAKEDPGKKASAYYQKVMSGFASTHPKFSSMVNHFRRTISEVIRFSKGSSQENYALWIGQNLSFDKGTVNFMDKMMSRYPEYHWLILSDAVGVKYQKAYTRIHRDVLILPQIPLPGGYIHDMTVNTVPQWAYTLLKQKPVLQNAVEALIAMGTVNGKKIDRNFSIMLFVFYYQLFTAIVKKLKPKQVFIWCKFMPAHQILAEVCREHNIQPVFVEFGLLPGTLNIERGGQMGESYAARYVEEFQQISVSPEQYEIAQDKIRNVRESKINRNVQTADPLDLEQHPLFKPGRPVITYFGQNDYDSGLYPYTETSRTYHSPAWKSSTDPLSDLIRLGNKNNWNIVYKPHPSVNYYGQGTQKVPEGVITVTQCNLHDLIDVSDVTLTILSQVSYEALIRQRPVIMLGYNQLRGKGCTYECYQKELLENTIIEALNVGFTDDMQEKFIQHIARMQNAFLFDDLSFNHERYGKTLEELDKVLLAENSSKMALVEQSASRESAVALNLHMLSGIPFRIVRKIWHLVPKKIRQMVRKAMNLPI